VCSTCSCISFKNLSKSLHNRSFSSLISNTHKFIFQSVFTLKLYKSLHFIFWSVGCFVCVSDRIICRVSWNCR
jgi:hypothetical protein